MVDHQVIGDFLPETPESLYHRDQKCMQYEAYLRSLDPPALQDMMDRLEAKLTLATLVGLPSDETRPSP